MTIKEFIGKLEDIRAKHGDDIEVYGWGDEAAYIGVEMYSVVGSCQTSEYMDDGDQFNDNKWMEIARKFGARTSRKLDNGITEFLADIRGTSISL